MVKTDDILIRNTIQLLDTTWRTNYADNTAYHTEWEAQESTMHTTENNTGSGSTSITIHDLKVFIYLLNNNKIYNMDGWTPLDMFLSAENKGQGAINEIPRSLFGILFEN